MMERLGHAGAGLALTGAILAGAADTKPAEALGHGSVEIVHDVQYEKLDGLVGCIVTVERLEQEDVGTQIVPPEDCPPDPNAIGQTALTELGSPAGTVYERTEAGVTAVAPDLPAIQEALQEAKNDRAANRVQKFGVVVLGLGILGTAADLLRRRLGSGSAPGNGTHPSPAPAKPLAKGKAKH
jgi:hypothetical protein